MQILIYDPDILGIKMFSNPVHILQLSKAEISTLRKAESILDSARDLAGEDSDFWLQAGVPSTAINELIEDHGQRGIRLT